MGRRAPGAPHRPPRAVPLRRHPLAGAVQGRRPVTGRIVNTVSESGLYGLAGQANYAAAKAGIASLTIVLGDVSCSKYGVTVNAIAPRARTRMTESVLGSLLPGEGEFDEWDPANIAPVVAWLASDAAADITGQVIVVNGDKAHLMEGWHRVGRIDNGGVRWTPADRRGEAGRAVRRPLDRPSRDRLRRMTAPSAEAGATRGSAG